MKETVTQVKQRVGHEIPKSTVNIPYRFSSDYKNKLANMQKASDHFKTRFITPYTTSKHLSHYRKRDLIRPAIKDT